MVTDDSSSLIPAGRIENAIVRSSPGVWFELHGAIYDKDRNVHRAPELTLNSMQDHLDEIVVWCNKHGVPCRIVTLKGRQQGSSTWSTGALYHACRRKRTKACIIGDQYERSVANLEAMFNLFADEDRFSWGNDYHKPSGKFSHGSQLVTETANAPRAGASGTFQSVLCTETAHWKETGVISGKKTFAALMSCVPKKAGTLVIVESTPNGVGGVYYDTYMGACTFAELKAGKQGKGWNGFVKVFYPWHEHPEYVKEVTEAEAAEIMGDLGEREAELVAEFGLSAGRLAWRREKIADVDFAGDEELFEQEYASDQERCFLLSGRRAFPTVPLQAMKKKAELEGPGRLKLGVLQWTDATESLAVFRGTGDDEAWCKVWELPTPGRRYVLSVDPMTGQAHGDDPDNHGIGIWRDGYWDAMGRWQALTLVARLTDVWAEKRAKGGKGACRWDIAVMEARVAMLASYYGWCLIVPELNMDRGMVELLKLRSRARIFVRMIANRIEQTEAAEYGWMTTVKTRGPILENLKRRVRTWQEPGEGIMIWDPVVIGEMLTMVVKENGKEEAMGGHHDDQVLMSAIGLATVAGGRVMPYPRIQGSDGMEPVRRNMTFS